VLGRVDAVVADGLLAEKPAEVIEEDGFDNVDAIRSMVDGTFRKPQAAKVENKDD
jgi:hypothetical protein